MGRIAELSSARTDEGARPQMAILAYASLKSIITGAARKPRVLIPT
jgi:hypothetical protein